MRNLKTQVLPLLRKESFIEALEEIHGSKIFVVGGAVRDFVLEKDPKDIDLLVVGVPLEKLHDVLTEHGKMDHVGESFAVTKFTPFNSTEEFDIAIPRKEVKTGDGHKDFEIVHSHKFSLEDDLIRRDFTMNALAMDLNGFIHDKFNGLNAIANRTIELVNPKAFAEDSLRMLRAIQFAARFEMDLSFETFDSIALNRKSIKDISGERILEELEKMTKGNINHGVNLLERTGLMLEIFGVHFRHDVLPLLTRTDLLLNLMFHKANNIREFFKTTLKGDAKTAIGLETIIEIFSEFEKINHTDENPIHAIRKMLFRKVKKSDLFFDCTLLPIPVLTVLDEFRAGGMPLFMSHIAISGNDVMAILNVSGSAVGEALEKIADEMLEGKLDNNFEDIKSFLKLL